MATDDLVTQLRSQSINRHGIGLEFSKVILHLVWIGLIWSLQLQTI